MDAGSTEAAVASAQEGQHLTSDSITDAAASAGSAEAGNAATSNNSEAPANAAGTSKPAMHANNNNNNQDSEVASSNPGEVDHPSGPIAAAASTTEVAASTAAAAPATMSSSLATFEQVLLKQEKKEELSLSQKLVKALCLAQIGLHRSVENEVSRRRDASSEDGQDDDEEEDEDEEDANDNDSDSEAALDTTRDATASASDAQTVLTGMKTADYSMLIETLASALRDADTQQHRLERFQDERGYSSEDDQDQDQGEDDDDEDCLKAPQDIPLPPSPTLSPKDASTTAGQVNKAVLDSLSSLIALIKPLDASQQSSADNASPDSSDRKDREDDTDGSAGDKADKSGSGKSGDQPALCGPCHMEKLPQETLTRIFKMARSQEDATACECGSISCPSGRVSYQQRFLKLRLLSKKLSPAATAASFSLVRIRTRPQIASLVSILSLPPSNQSSEEQKERTAQLAKCVKHIEIKVPALTLPYITSGNDSRSLLSPHRSRSRSSAFPWLQTPDSPTASASSSASSLASTAKGEGSEGESSGPPPSEQPIGPLVRLCPSLFTFDLSVSRSNSYSYSSWSLLSDFLESGLQPALSDAPALKTLIFKQCVNYGELEQILLDCPTITDIRLEGGLDNLDGRDDALDDMQHQCRLKTFYLNNWESVDVGERQLCWILRPSAGHLTNLEIATSVSLNAGGLGGAGFPPFAGSHFADLLCELGPTLQRLALKDSVGPGIGGMINTQLNPNLRAAPHYGSLDEALSHCTSVRELALEWSFTGANFFSSIENAPLFSLVLLGAPTATPASELISRLRHGFSELHYLNLISFGTQAHQPHSWSARDVRQVRKACQDRDLAFTFSASL